MRLLRKAKFKGNKLSIVLECIFYRKQFSRSNLKLGKIYWNYPKQQTFNSERNREKKLESFRKKKMKEKHLLIHIASENTNLLKWKFYIFEVLRIFITVMIGNSCAHECQGWMSRMNVKITGNRRDRISLRHRK